MFLLFKPNTEEKPKPVAPMTPGHVGWHELYAGDLDREFAFYSRLFGWTKDRAIDMGSMGTYQTFATGGAPCGGMMKACAQVQRPTVRRPAAPRSCTAQPKSPAAPGSATPKALPSPGERAQVSAVTPVA